MRCKYTKDFREICSALQISFIFALFLQNIAISRKTEDDEGVWQCGLSRFFLFLKPFILLDNPFSDGALLAVVIDTYLI